MLDIANIPKTIAQLRYEAKKFDLKLSEKNGNLALIEYYDSCDAWIHIFHCRGDPYCLSIDEVTSILDEQRQA